MNLSTRVEVSHAILHKPQLPKEKYLCVLSELHPDHESWLGCFHTSERQYLHLKFKKLSFKKIKIKQFLPVTYFAASGSPFNKHFLVF